MSATASKQRAAWEPRQDPFEASQSDAVRKTLAEAATLPPWCYNSTEFYAREVERVFGRGWNFVGHVDPVSVPGQYVTGNLVGAPFIVVRGKDGVIRAFAITCRHSGALLLEGAARPRRSAVRITGLDV